MAQEKRKERGAGEKAESKTRKKTKANLPYLFMGLTSEAEILHLEQKPAKCSTYRRRFGQFGLFI